MEGETFQTSLDNPRLESFAYIVGPFIIGKMEQIRIVQTAVLEYPVIYSSNPSLVIFCHPGGGFVQTIKNCFHDNHVIHHAWRIIKTHRIENGISVSLDRKSVV